MSKKSELTAERLREVLTYDHLTGEFRWRVARGSRAGVGRVAGATNTEGYLQIRVDGPSYLAHRLAWLHVHGSWPTDQLDHINGDQIDNRIANLREVTNQENQHNQCRPHYNNTVGFLGVSTSYGKWRARIRVGARRVHLGTFDSPEAAHAAYLAAKRKFHPSAPIVEKP